IRVLKMFGHASDWELYRFRRKRKLHSARGSGMLCGMFLAASASAGFFGSTCLFPSAIWARQTDPAKPVVVQPGAPGKPSRTLPPSTRATLPPRSQADVEFMQGMDMSREPMGLMPGMLTPQQMEALRKSKGAEFDRLFLSGMIQHHNGALTMVKDLFDTAGTGQDAEMFGFATDVDTGQRAEIKIMQTMLEQKHLEEKR